MSLATNGLLQEREEEVRNAIADVSCSTQMKARRLHAARGSLAVVREAIKWRSAARQQGHGQLAERSTTTARRCTSAMVPSPLSLSLMHVHRILPSCLCLCVSRFLNTRHSFHCFSPLQVVRIPSLRSSRFSRPLSSQRWNVGFEQRRRGCATRPCALHTRSPRMPPLQGSSPATSRA